jgi:hypothetical protein
MNKIRVFDIMIMIAATALGLGLYRIHETPSNGSQWNCEYVVRMVPLFVMWSMTLAILRFRQPRPRVRRLFRQPGMAACSTSLIVLTVFFPLRLLMLLQSQGEYLGAGVDFWYPIAFQSTLPWVGVSVAAVWLNLLLSGLWITESSWIDRLGRLVGVYWLGVLILGVVNG